MYDGHKLYKTVPEKKNANILIVAKSPILFVPIKWTSFAMLVQWNIIEFS